jgi:hypothetical protein
MKTNFLLSTTLLAFALTAGPAIAADSHSGHGAAAKPAAAPTDAEIIARARASYPLKTCLVADEALGSMGDAVGYIHRAAGQPDRVVFVCCEGCIDDFKADPAKFLKKVDAAAAAKSKKS